MHQRICLITGANSGIGKEAAVQIAKEGYLVLLGSRNPERGEAAVSEVKRRSESDAVELLSIDLASAASVRAAADEIVSRHGRLDVLIHNAAEFDISRKVPLLSPDGIETVWQTNHIGPALLTGLVLGLLERSGQGRIITVASKGLAMHPFLKVKLDDPELRTNGFSVERAYYQSKLAQVMYTFGLAEELRHTRVTVNCVRVTNVKVDLTRYPNLRPFLKRLYALKSKAAITPERMARTYTRLATAPELYTVTGRYIDERNRVVGSSEYSRKKENIDAVMELTKRYVERLRT